MDERRKGERYVVTFPVMIGSQGRFSFVTMTKNAADSGLLVMTAVSLEKDEPVTVTYRTGEGTAGEQSVTGRIVRVEENKGPNAKEWPYLAALEFSDAQPELEKLLKEEAGAGDGDS